MRLSKLIDENLIITDLEAKTKDEAVEKLLDLIKSKHPVLDRNKILKAVREREEIENTCYGHGYAFPHARTDAVERMYIVLGISRTGLRDETPDGQPLRVICLMLTPSHISQLYLQALSAFAAFARSHENTDKLLHAGKPPEVVDIIFDSKVRVDRDLLVRDIMVERVISVSPDHTLKQVANMLYKNRIGSMPVTDSDGKVIGQISNRDLIKAAMPDYKTLIENMSMAADLEPFEDLLKSEDNITAEMMMQKEPAVTYEDTPVVEVAAQMLFKNLRMVPVVREGKLVGVVVISDIVSKIIRG